MADLHCDVFGAGWIASSGNLFDLNMARPVGGRLWNLSARIHLATALGHFGGLYFAHPMPFMVVVVFGRRLYRVRTPVAGAMALYQHGVTFRLGRCFL